MPTLTIPNSFTPNTVAYSAQVNANFNAVATLLNSTLLDHTNIQTGGLTAASLAAGSVTAAKLDSSVADGTTITQNGSGALEVANNGVDMAQLANDVTFSLVPTGCTLEYYGTTAPSGWLMCDGSAVSRSTYATLFSVIGVSCGIGNGTTTFNVPDHRGYFIRGTDNMGTSAGAAGRDPEASSRTAMGTSGNTGDNVGSVQGSQFASHTHGVDLYGSASGGPSIPAEPQGTFNSTLNTDAAGGTETRPINAYANKIIKT